MCRIKYLILFSALCALLLNQAVSEETLIDPESAAVGEETFVTQPVERGTLIKNCSANGDVVYPCETPVCFEGDEAVFVEFFVETRDSVKAGDPLMTLSPVIDEVHLAETELKLQRSKEALADTQEDYARRIAEIDTDAGEIEALQAEILQVELERYELQQNHAIDLLQVEVDALYAAKENVTVHAPCDGTIASKTHFREGETLAKGALICTIASRDIRLLRLESPSFRYGMRVEIKNGQGDNAKITSGIVVAAANTMPLMPAEEVLVLAEEPPKDSGWKSSKVTGHSIELDDVLIIPRSAAELKGGRNYVKILSEDGIPQRRCIAIGTTSSTEAWVVAGLEDGDSIIMK